MDYKNNLQFCQKYDSPDTCKKSHTVSKRILYTNFMCFYCVLCVYKAPERSKAILLFPAKE